MTTMQAFYNQLMAVDTAEHPYHSYLHKLTQLQPAQLTALKQMLWWNGWGIDEG